VLSQVGEQAAGGEQREHRGWQAGHLGTQPARGHLDAAPGDIDLDGFIDVSDIAALVGSGLFDTGRPAAWWEGDVNYDGVVDSLDLGEMLGGGLYDAGSYRP